MNIEVKVEWTEDCDMDDNSDAIRWARASERSIKGYITAFNLLPVKGMIFENDICDPTEVMQISYNGITHTVFLILRFTTL